MGLFPAFAIGVLILTFPTPDALARDAYVANFESANVSVIDTQTNQVIGAPIGVGSGPIAVAITPNGKRAYVANFGSKNVSVIDTQANQVVGAPITVGKQPVAIAISPDGKSAYVVSDGSNSVSVIDTETNQVVGSPIKMSGSPEGIAITPDGRSAYVADFNSGTASVIDTQSRQVVGAPIGLGEGSEEIAITPDGRTAYVTNANSFDVSVIDTLTNQVIGSPIEVGEIPGAVVITPDGRTAYVADYNGGEVSLIDTQSKLTGSPIPIVGRPAGIAITPDGRTAYVSVHESKKVLVFNAQTNQTLTSPIGVGKAPGAIAITPDQPPLASFSVSVTRARPGVPLAFNASASSDPDGTIARYEWRFGDGAQLLGVPNPSHAYAAPGTYQATLALTDNEGCSTTLIFTGQTAYCNGQAAAAQTQTIKVAYPGVRVKCPKSARPNGCRFKLQAVSKRRGKVETGTAKVKAKAGKSLVVSLKPKKRFRSKLATAKKILVKETVTSRGSTRIVIRKLKIVQ